MRSRYTVCTTAQLCALVSWALLCAPVTRAAALFICSAAVRRACVLERFAALVVVAPAHDNLFGRLHRPVHLDEGVSPVPPPLAAWFMVWQSFFGQRHGRSCSCAVFCANIIGV